MNNLVCIQHREAVTTSLIVGDVFHKQHKSVLRKIDNLLSELPENDRRNFAPVTHVDAKGEIRPMYEMTRDGFSLLAMSFTGKKALEFKLKFLDAFNQMEKALRQRENLSWQQQRSNNKIARHCETDTIARFVEYATAQGSKHANLYYVNLTKATNHALGLAKLAETQSLRDTMNAIQLSFMASAEHIIRLALEEGMSAGLHYKAVYEITRNKILAFAGSLPSQRHIPA